MRKVALSANLAWICWILARFAMKGGQVQEPKLMTSGVVREAAVLRRETSAPVVGWCSTGSGAGPPSTAVCISSINIDGTTMLDWDFTLLRSCKFVMKKSLTMFQV